MVLLEGDRASDGADLAAERILAVLAHPVDLDGEGGFAGFSADPDGEAKGGAGVRSAA